MHLRKTSTYFNLRGIVTILDASGFHDLRVFGDEFGEGFHTVRPRGTICILGHGNRGKVGWEIDSVGKKTSQNDVHVCVLLPEQHGLPLACFRQIFEHSVHFLTGIGRWRTKQRNLHVGILELLLTSQNYICRFIFRSAHIESQPQTHSIHLFKAQIEQRVGFV